MTRMRIVAFEPALAGAFRTLNEAWIARYFALEAKDAEVLGDPQGQVVDRGGQVLFALEGDTAVGCCALIRLADRGFELAKMAVDERFQGRGIGKALLRACIDYARGCGAPRIYLESNGRLDAALGLYRAFGFTDVPAALRPPSPYARANVWMELKL
jgi:ribosomal protein S18 acetylase RimI-like enzyme